jgi:transposase
VKGPIQYGPTVEATVGYLSAYQYIPYRRITHFFRDCFRLDLSEGTISKLLTGLSDKATIAYEAIHEQVKQSAVVGADETGCHVNGKKTWFHVWQDGLHTFIVHAFSRGYQVIEKHFPEGFLQSFHVSDCYASQLKTPAKGHQLCMAHLLRELSNFIKNLDSQWSIQMKELIQKAIELKKKLTGEDDRNTSSEIAQLNRQLDELLTVDCRKFHKKEQAFVKRLNKHRESILTFLTSPDVPPDNNASERAIRNVKVKTKVSGQFRNKDGKGADQYAKLRSVIDTTIKNGQEVYATLLSIANNWRIVPE